MKTSTYTPLVVDPANPIAFGVWVNIPFRRKGATEIRQEAKTRGARYEPKATGSCSWWVPVKYLTNDTVCWFNDNKLFRGIRNAPTFNENLLSWSDISNGFVDIPDGSGGTKTVVFNTFVLSCDVPFEEKDLVKIKGAVFNCISKKWQFDSYTLTEKTYKFLLDNKYAYSFAGFDCTIRGITNTTNPIVFLSFQEPDMNSNDLPASSTTLPQGDVLPSAALVEGLKGWVLSHPEDGCFVGFLPIPHNNNSSMMFSVVSKFSTNPLLKIQYTDSLRPCIASVRKLVERESLNNIINDLGKDRPFGNDSSFNHAISLEMYISIKSGREYWDSLIADGWKVCLTA